jgi:transposase
MCTLLRRLGFVHKKASQTPGKADGKKQEAFIKAFNEFMENKSEDTPVLFMDACHPQHNSMPSYGWIYKGERVEIPSNTGRERLNLNGAVNAETHEVTVIDSPKINADSTIELFKRIEMNYAEAPFIYIFSDNAKYYHCAKVRDFLSRSRIILYNLPPYSPNLNIIERVWKFFHKVVLNNQYYETFQEFRNACLIFFDSIADYKDKLKTLLTLNFQKFSDSMIRTKALN